MSMRRSSILNARVKELRDQARKSFSQMSEKDRKIRQDLILKKLNLKNSETTESELLEIMNKGEKQRAILKQILYERGYIIQRFRRAMRRLIIIGRITRKLNIDISDFSFENLQDMIDFTQVNDDEKAIIDESKMSRAMIEQLVNNLNYRSVIHKDHIDEMKAFTDKVKLQTKEQTAGIEDVEQFSKEDVDYREILQDIGLR